MNWFLATPLEFRLAGLAVVGVVFGSLANLAIYRLAWSPRAISPWSQPAPDAPPRRWTDRIPILGWFGLCREAPLHGRGFWIRPMLVELAFGAGMAALYWWEVPRQGLLLAQLGPGAFAPPFLHAEYLCHVVVIWLMLVASLIDADEKIIPDEITLPGALFGLAAAAVSPWSLLPTPWWEMAPWGGRASFGFLNLASPNLWPGWVADLGRTSMLTVGLACWWLWCVALLPRTWYARHGWRRAMGLMMARLARTPSTLQMLMMGVIGSILIAATWYVGGLHWVGLLTALVGMAGAGGLVWLVRVLGSAVLHQEAMGFGDVTLMAMLGTFFGWQGCLVVFFLAPLAGLGIGLFLLILRREREIPYGPFLCLAALVVIVRWAAIWNWFDNVLGLLGPWIPGFLLGLLVMMAVLLWFVRRLRELLFGV